MDKLRVDLHHYRQEEAYEHLLDKIDEALDNNIYLIEVVHGFNRGNVLKQMVENLSSNDHPYILRIRKALNNSGTTYIELKMDIY